MKNKKRIIIFLVICIILSGFGREYMMKNINWVVKYLTHGGGFWAQSMFKPLLSWSLKELTILKWGLTLLFTLYFYALTFALVKLIFNNKYYSKLTTLTFITIFLISFVVYVFGYLINDIQVIYPTVRNLMGLLQSFIPFMVLYLLFKFIPQKKHN